MNKLMLHLAGSHCEGVHIYQLPNVPSENEEGWRATIAGFSQAWTDNLAGNHYKLYSKDRKNEDTAVAN